MIVDFGVKLLKWAFILAGFGIWYKIGEFINNFIPGLGTFLFLFIPVLIGTCLCNGKTSFKINMLCSALFTIVFILFMLWCADIL